MVNPPRVYLKRDGSNENTDLNIGNYDLIADIVSSNAVTTNAISSNRITVETIVNTDWTDLTDGGQTTLHTHTGGITLSGPLVGNLGGEWQYGISSLTFVSSQTISGGVIKGHWIGSPLTSDYVTDYIASSTAISRFAPSKSINNGLQEILDGSGSIAHGLISTPNYWNVRPSGNVNFGINTKVDATNIYVNLTTQNDKYVYWYAST